MDTPDLAELYGLSLVEALDRLYQRATTAAIPKLERQMAKSQQELMEQATQIVAEFEARGGKYEAGVRQPVEAKHKTEASSQAPARRVYKAKAPRLLEDRQLESIRFELGRPPQFLLTGSHLSTHIRDVLAHELEKAAGQLIRGLCEGTIELEGAVGSLPPQRISKYVFRTACVFQRRGARLSVLDDDGRTRSIYDGVHFVSPPRAATSAKEKRALEWVIKDLRERGVEGTSKLDRLESCVKKFGVTTYGFNTRIWPEALRVARLTDAATKAGRKKRKTAQSPDSGL
jgi:hypothetical protein